MVGHGEGAGSSEGAHVLDVCVAYVGRDEVRDMVEVMRRFNTQVSLPLMIDSTEVHVLEAALKLCAGRAIINSINFEEGTEKAEQDSPSRQAIRIRCDRAVDRRGGTGL